MQHDDAGSVRGQRLVESVREIVRRRDFLRLDAEALGVADEIHRIIELAGRVTLVVKDLLQLADHAEAGIVHDQGNHRQAEPRNRIILAARHLDAAVARHVNHASLLSESELRALRRRKPEAHRTEPARGQPCARLFDMEMQRAPHLMLSHVRREREGLARRRTRHMMQRPRQRQPRHVVIVCVFLSPAFDALPPCV